MMKGWKGVTLKAKFARAEPLLQDVSAKLEELAEKLPGLILPSGTNHMSACSSCLKNPDGQAIAIKLAKQINKVVKSILKTLSEVNGYLPKDVPQILC
ncbi:uncharacterized protein LOC111332133 isoform X2 [Stylophora pistillata]|uniref:uncharacterized protein LOC111332133 isoform X2 n=1 Tax=Stylophora pistillata TaxID=50429 RepID=UPI000C046712|nr:uncharacterized protein LOC111332133 isoform X2 [Stylophora pistillata]XP_022793153.1 uncharacterized protein LOC111332133 isoform X2 [Stylophora pistillata]